ncbi:MAG: hypothetical protein WC859_03920 [Elusimicrobiota bacterium]|jgi:hypothetical protein
MRKAFFVFFLLVSALSIKAADPSVVVPRMNQMNGSILSIDTDSRVIRVTVEDGFNVEFAYSSKTQISDREHSVEIGELGYGDQVIVKYEGRELIAKRIERLEKAHRTLPTLPPETAGTEASSDLLSSSPAVPANQPTN